MSTPIQDPIAHACRLLREAAEELKSGHTLAKTGHDWTGEPEAKAAYDEHRAVADALERWESAIGAGGAEPLRRRECLHQIAEPAGERTAKDSAIEHAEYMAQDAERLLSAINTLNAQCDEDGAAFDEAEQAQAEEAVSEAFRAMRSGIHEFRKRRDRAIRAQAAHAVTDDTHAFQNFHRALCERFGYTHDARDWRRDQVSLIEHIAKLAAPAAVAGPSEDVRKKIETNTWDHFGDILPTLKAISRGEWYWGANSRCKYIEIRLDTRDGGCILYDRDRVRISPAQFAFQAGGGVGKMEPWPAKNALAAAPTTQAAPAAHGDALAAERTSHAAKGSRLVPGDAA